MCLQIEISFRPVSGHFLNKDLLPPSLNFICWMVKNYIDNKAISAQLRWSWDRE